MSIPLGYVPDDGYTKSSFIKGEERLTPDLRIKHRPMTNRQQQEMVQAINMVSGAKIEDVSMGAVLSHLVEWDLKENPNDPKSKTLAITMENLLRLEPVLAGAIFAVVTGRRAGDYDSRQVHAEASETNSYLQDLEDESNGREVTTATRTQQGNSVAG